MKVRAVYKDDGTVTIITPAPKSRKKGESEKVWLSRVFEKAMTGSLAAFPYDDIESNELPQTDRSAWTGEKGKGVSIDQAKAQALKSDKTRKDLIDEEKERILEEQAIASLEAQNKL
jgi:hypothetical protein